MNVKSELWYSFFFFPEGINISKSFITDKPYYRSTLYCKKYREDRRRSWYLVKWFWLQLTHVAEFQRGYTSQSHIKFCLQLTYAEKLLHIYIP